MATPADEQLARAAQAGSQDAFSTLAARFHGRLFRFLRMRCRCAATAEDIAQDTLLRAWSRLDRFDPTRSFATWLFTIAARLATNAATHNDRQQAHRADLEPAQLVDSRDPAAAASRDEDGRNLWALAQRVLDPTSASALWLFYAEQRGSAEIADILGRSDGAIRLALHRARRCLAHHLEPLSDERPGDTIPASQPR